MAKKRSVQTTDVEPQVGGVSLPITFITAADVAPEWDLADRDAFLRGFWKRFGNDMLQSVLATVVAKVQTQNWELEGPKRLVKMYHSVLRDETDFHRGWDSLISRGLQDYYTQDNGWFIERFRSGKRDREGPCLGFAHLDSYRMRPTGNTDFPYTYEDVYGAYHLMHRSQFIRIVDLPSPETALYHHQKGFCALSRTLSTAIILTMIVAMKREKLADLPPSALAIFNNISRKQFENALRLQGAHDDMKDNMIWRQLLPLFGVDPAHAASVQFLSLREVWEGYDDQTAYDIAAYSFAAGFRIDPREFWPVSQGPLGTGKEAEVQHQKAKGKGHGLMFTALERNLNSKDSLPERVIFRFNIQDVDEEEQRSAIYAQQITNVESMQKAGAGLTAAEVRFLLCNQYKILPKVLLKPPAEGVEPSFTMADVYMDDVERQIKEFGGFYFGPIVIMEDNGRIHEPVFDRAFKALVDGPIYIGDQLPAMITAVKGGPGSGNWGHAGRPGMVGGSASTSGGVAAAPSLRSKLSDLRPSLAEAAQKVYDAWEQDEFDDYGGGGICDDIAVEMASIIADETGAEVRDGGQPGDDHAWLIVFDPDTEEVLGVDIPPGVYETGGGYSWTKIEDVTISPDDVEVFDTGFTMDEVYNWIEPGEGWEVYEHGPGPGEEWKELRKLILIVKGDLPSKKGRKAVGAKESAISILSGDFACCESHAAQELPTLIDNLTALGYLSPEESYAADLLPSQSAFAIAADLKEMGHRGDDLIISFVRGLRRQLGIREYSLGDKATSALETIDQKIAGLPRPVARQVREASADLFDAMKGDTRLQRILDIPDDVWEEAERRDLQDEQPEVAGKESATKQITSTPPQIVFRPDITVNVPERNVTVNVPERNVRVALPSVKVTVPERNVTVEAPNVSVEQPNVVVNPVVRATLTQPDQVIETETMVERDEMGLIRKTTKTSRSKG